MQSRFEALSNLTERYGGYGSSVRRVMEQKDRQKGICGVVADLITTEKAYETAIETALGGRIQNIVTETEEDAKALIRFLKTNAFGRATFLPLDTVTARSDLADHPALKETGCLGRAADLVRFDPRYQAAAEYLLGHILVIRDMEKASAIARKYRYKLNLVTLEGEYLSPGGALSGGAFKNASNLLGRRRELSELEKSVRKEQKELDKIEEMGAEVSRSCASLHDRLESVRSLTEEARLSLLSVQMQLEEKQRALNDLTSGCADSRRSEKELQQQLAAAEADKRASEEKNEQLEKENALRRREIGGITARVEREKNRRAEKARALEALRVEFAGLEQKNGFMVENIRRLNGELERCRSEAEQLRKD